jgi:hypothetical protein
MERRFPEAFQSCAEILKYQRRDPLIKEDINILIPLSGAKLKESKELAQLLEKIESGLKPQTEAPKSAPK